MDKSFRKLAGNESIKNRFNVFYTVLPTFKKMNYVQK